MAATTKVSAAEWEDAIVAAYRKGTKVSVIEQEFDIGRQSLYHLLRRRGVNLRSRHQTTIGDNEAAGFFELLRHQDARIVELESALEDALRKIKWLEKARSKAV